MGRKSSAKAQGHSAPAAPPPKEPPRSTRAAIAAVVVIVAVVGVLLYSRSGRTPDPGSPSQPVAQHTEQVLTSNNPPAAAKFGPHRQDRLPSLPLNQAIPVRPIAEVNEAYVFSAEHPEVLGYMPCYCGCEREGHRGNDDCFVRRRAPNGDVIEWEPHGMT
jgi:hypothetical protein